MFFTLIVMIKLGVKFITIVVKCSDFLVSNRYKVDSNAFFYIFCEISFKVIEAVKGVKLSKF